MMIVYYVDVDDGDQRGKVTIHGLGLRGGGDRGTGECDYDCENGDDG